MKISIITVTYNSAATLEETIQSVFNQDYNQIEYIIVDGLSSDNTLEIANRYKNKISKIISEKDNGLYDALNKGISLASGDIIGFLHSDDVFANNQVISKVAGEFEKNHQLKLVYADLVFVDRNNLNKITRVWKSGYYHPGAFLKGWMPPHPTLFVKRNVYLEYGFFNTELKFAADYELMLRLIHKHKLKIGYLNEVTVKMRMGGISNTNFTNKLKANFEDRLAWKLNGLKPSAFFSIQKPMRKVFQYFQRSWV